MKPFLIYPKGRTQACQYAAEHLQRLGISITDHPSPEVTHLLLDVPGFRPDGLLRSGEAPDAILSRLSEDVTIISGNIPAEYPNAINLLKNQQYLWENAAITAECAMHLAAQKCCSIFRGGRVLIIGWGRIGKHLSRLLTASGAEVTIASRSEAHLAEAASFGLKTHPEKNYTVIFNTAPGAVFPREAQITGLKIDLASQPGLSGPDVIIARGLPGIHAPERSGELIAGIAFQLIKEEDL